MMLEMRIPAALVVGLVLVFGFPVGAVAADDATVPSRLTIGGLPLARLVRTEPSAPFVAFDAAFVRLGTQTGGASQTAGGGNQGGGNRRKIVLVSAAIGAGIGMSMGASRCGNEGSTFCPILGLWSVYGLGVGTGVGALVAAIAGN
jgi:hypothetical protein